MKTKLAKMVATRFWKGGRLPTMLGSLQNFLRRKKQAIANASLVFLLLAGFLYLYEPSSPDGVYFDENIACGHGCWIFKDGKFYIQCDGGKLDYIGIYLKSGNCWTVQTKSNDGWILKPTIFGMKIVSAQIKNGRVFWPRDCFSWTIDCKEWIAHTFSHDRQTL